MGTGMEMRWEWIGSDEEGGYGGGDWKDVGGGGG